MYRIVGALADWKDQEIKLPTVVVDYIVGILQILDAEYGAERDIYEDDGGFIFIGTEASDLAAIKEYVDVEDAIYESIDVIPTDKGEYAVAMYLSNNEFSIHIVLPKDCIPSDWKEDLA